MPLAAAPGPDVDRMLAHVRHLAERIGVRKGGSPQEARAADYICSQLTGHQVTRQKVPLPGGRSSVNVIVGPEDSRYLVGAHLDSKPPSPGGNDNATGVAVLLELARLRTPGTRLAFFGAEEILDSNPDHHHYGSRYYVSQMKVRPKGMICVDSVGAGPDFVIGTMAEPSELSRQLRVIARDNGSPARSMVDPGWSDHEPFFMVGIPTAYVRWRVDAALHTAADDASHVDGRKVLAAARVVHRFLTR